MTQDDSRPPRRSPPRRSRRRAAHRRGQPADTCSGDDRASLHSCGQGNLPTRQAARRRGETPPAREPHTSANSRTVPPAVPPPAAAADTVTTAPAADEVIVRIAAAARYLGCTKPDSFRCARTRHLIPGETKTDDNPRGGQFATRSGAS
jgi:hypothetical protein